MAVTLNVRTEDMKLEELLNYLDTHGEHPHEVSKIKLLEKAVKWLRASLPVTYACFESEIAIRLVTEDSAPRTAEPPR